MTDLFAPLPDELGTRRRENTRSRLIRASLAVFVDKGIDGATIDDLVSAAGFTRGAFYSSFSRKEEAFAALFEEVTDKVIEIVRSSVSGGLGSRAVDGGCPVSTVRDGEGQGSAEADEAAMMVDVFEAIRPYGRQWYLLHSEATARALRSEDGLEGLSVQRGRLREAIADALRLGLDAKDETCLIEVEALAQLLVGIFVDFMVQEHLDDADITERAAVTILRVIHAFVVPSAPQA